MHIDTTSLMAYLPVASDSELWVDADGIVHLRPCPAAVQSVELARSDFEAVVAASPTRPVLYFVDCRRVSEVARDVREYWASPEVTSQLKGLALVTSWGLNRFVASFVLGRMGKDRPFRLFTAEAEALAWLRELGGIPPKDPAARRFVLYSIAPGTFGVKWTIEHATADDMTAAVAAVERAAAGRPYRVLVEAYKLRGLSARSWHEMKRAKADRVAVIMTSNIVLTAANLMSSIMPLPYPVRYFATREPAVEWLTDSRERAGATAAPDFGNDRVKEILDVVSAYARKEFGARAPVLSDHDQLDLIAAGINLLGEELAAAVHELDTMNRRLEHLVTARTRELEDSRATLVASAKMSALGEMAGGIAHEINNPLAVIIGRSRQLMRLLESGAPSLDKLRDGLQLVRTMSDRIARTVSSLRTFSRDGSTDPLQPATVQDIVAETLELCKERFRAHDVPLEIELPDTPIVIACRSVQISQVLANLLMNAFDACEGLSERWVRVEAEASPKGVSIAVTDSGPGIPLEMSQRIFDPFFTTKPVGKGTGLGLSISLGIARGHAGSLKLDPSSPHTRFVLQLPARVDA